MSARSWARVRASSGPWRARAAAVVRAQIPAAVSAGRCAESQAMPSRSGTNSTRRSAALVVWRSSMLTGWWRSRQARALARNRDGTRSPAGQPRAGFGASGSRKCASSAGRPGRIQAGGFVDDDPGVGPGDRPGPQRGQGQRQPRCQRLGVGQEGCGGAFADGQDTGDLGHQGQLLGGAVLRGRRRRRQEPGRPGVIGGQLNLQRGRPGLQPGHLGEPVQATVRQIPQRISITQRIGAGRSGAGRIGAVSAGASDGSQRSRGRGHGRHGLPAVRTPRCSAFHDPIKSGGTDNNDGTGCGATRRRT